jgi:hypothetical protein
LRLGSDRPQKGGLDHLLWSFGRHISSRPPFWGLSGRWVTHDLSFFLFVRAHNHWAVEDWQNFIIYNILDGGATYVHRVKNWRAAVVPIPWGRQTFLTSQEYSDTGTRNNTPRKIMLQKAKFGKIFVALATHPESRRDYMRLASGFSWRAFPAVDHGQRSR